MSLSRPKFLRLLWTDVINEPIDEEWIDFALDTARKSPTKPFADVGLIVERLLALGASRRELALLARSAAYNAVFSVLYKLGDPGIKRNDIHMLHESLLTSDPSGNEGRSRICTRTKHLTRRPSEYAAPVWALRKERLCS